MSALPGFTVAQNIDAPAATVWAALTSPALLAQWHGWDFDGLAAEIQYIYFDHATVVPPMTLQQSDDSDTQSITVRAEGTGSVITAHRPGQELPGAFDMIVAGWRQFFAQLQYLIERRPDGRRRTIFLDGEASPAALAAALPDTAPGAEWHRDEFQFGWASADPAGALTILVAGAPLTSDSPAPVIMTVSTFGLDDAAFAAAETRWRDWWSTRVAEPRATED